MAPKSTKAAAPRKSALSNSATPDVHPVVITSGAEDGSGSRSSSGNNNQDKPATKRAPRKVITDPLAPGFNVNKLTVTQLRQLLFEHDVAVLSNGRKATLIEAYEVHIEPNLDEIRAQRNAERNIRPDGTDIVYLGNGQVGRSPSISVGGSAISEAEASSENEEARAAHRQARSRRSVSWADSVQSGEEEEEEDPDVSNFSLENPFQSSPKEGFLSKLTSAASQTRKSRPSGGRSSLTVPKQRHHHRAASSDEDEGAEADVSREGYTIPPTSPSIQKQRRARQWVDHAQSDAEDDEEENFVSGQRVAQKAKSGFSDVFIFAAFVVMSTWWLWYAAESKTVGFCDPGRTSNAVLDQRFADAAVQAHRSQVGIDPDAPVAEFTMPLALRPTCTPCPAHALCSAGELTSCENSDYILERTFLSHVPILRNLLPLSKVAPSCEPDEEKVLLAADLADEIENKLRTWKADVYCGRHRARFGPRDDPDWGEEGIYALPLSDLYTEMQRAAERGMALRGQSEEFFSELWALALSDLESSGRIFHRSSRLLAAQGPVGVGLSCRSRLAATSIWQRLRLWIVGIVTLSLVFQWLRYRLRGTSDMQRKSQDLVETALTKLQAAKRRSMLTQHQQSPYSSANASPASSGTEGYLSITQLRDSILRQESRQSSRKTLWARVTKLVEANTNVRTRQAKVQGEWTRVWEWVGPIEDVGNASTSTQRQAIEASPSEGKGRGILENLKQFDPPSDRARPQVDQNGRWGAPKQQQILQTDDYNADYRRRPGAEI